MDILENTCKMRLKSPDTGTASCQALYSTWPFSLIAVPTSGLLFVYMYILYRIFLLRAVENFLH